MNQTYHDDEKRPGEGSGMKSERSMDMCPAPCITDVDRMAVLGALDIFLIIVYIVSERDNC